MCTLMSIIQSAWRHPNSVFCCFVSSRLSYQPELPVRESPVHTLSITPRQPRVRQVQGQARVPVCAEPAIGGKRALHVRAGQERAGQGRRQQQHVSLYTGERGGREGASSVVGQYNNCRLLLCWGC